VNSWFENEHQFHNVFFIMACLSFVLMTANLIIMFSSMIGDFFEKASQRKSYMINVTNLFI